MSANAREDELPADGAHGSVRVAPPPHVTPSPARANPSAPSPRRPPPHRPSAGKGTFRPDVEGMRALAISLVILAHAGVPYAAGGYVGVDVFFVISGFLITRLLLAEVDRTQTVSLVTFYARRIKRLLPQALLAVVAVVVASWALLTPLKAEAVSRDVIAAGCYVINWHFAAQAVDYFAATGAHGPLDHFWSLAVEEQYYLVWPLALLLITRPWRRRPRAAHRAVAVTLVALTALSLFYAIRLVAVTPSQAYFSTPARAWELGLGGLLALAPLGRLPAAVASGAAWCGIGAILAATVLFGSNTAFPGVAALLPTLGAAALVAAGAGRRRPVPTRVLSLGPAQALGRASYAWYVWHWPVLVFATTVLGPLSTLGALGAMAVSLVPTIATHRWIEEPIRRSDLHRRRPRLALVGAPVAAALMVLMGAGLATRLPATRTIVAREAVGAPALHRGTGLQASADALRPAPQDADADRSRAYYDGCLVSKGARSSPACVYGDRTAARTVVVFGDSHAMQYFPALERVARERHWRLVELTKSGCPAADVPVRDFSAARVYAECRDWREAAMRRIVSAHPQMVVTSGSARSYLVFARGRTLGREASEQALVQGYARTLERLRHIAGLVTVIHDTPRPPFDVPDCVAGSLDHLRRCGFSREPARARPDPISAAALRVPGVRLIDPIDEFCRSGVCPAVVGNVLVYRQTGHITATYMSTLTPWFRRHLPALTGRAQARSRTASPRATAPASLRTSRSGA